LAKFSLLLLDTGIIIMLFELGIWDAFLERCDDHISRTVMNEAIFYVDNNGETQPIHLSTYTTRMTVHDVGVSRILELKKIFGSVLLDKLDAGEAEIITVLHDSLENYRICSADAVVYRVLPALARSSQGISLEEVLNHIGLSRKVSWPFSKRFRETYTQRGFQEKLTGILLPD
jgi:hypothetical protein